MWIDFNYWAQAAKMLFPVALTHATEEMSWIRILFCMGDFVSLCHPQAQLYLKPKYQGIFPCVLIFPAGEAPHGRNCLEWCESLPTGASPGLSGVTHSPREGVRLQLVWADATRIPQDCMLRRAELSPQNIHIILGWASDFQWDPAANPWPHSSEVW